jgi:Xanthine and CO dehydrogenases maturation factor, XdhC/CoxF family
MTTDFPPQPSSINVRPAVVTDQAAGIFGFLADALADGQQCALVTQVEIIGGASRALGAHMAVRSDGGYCGYVSGGCIEAAVAHEALEAIAEGRDRVCRFGKGSPYFDIVLPCGGGISLAIHVLKEADTIKTLFHAMTCRKTTGLCYDPAREKLSIQDNPSRTGWQDGVFISVYRPEPRIFLLGRGIEGQRFMAVASAAGLSVTSVDADTVRQQTDRETAVVLLTHDIDKELPVLRAALETDGFYIGCLGSRRTHARRIEILGKEGYPPHQLNRIHGPIGLFGPAREARSVAVSVLAEILSQAETLRL